jgi:hypothetical protein
MAAPVRRLAMTAVTTRRLAMTAPVRRLVMTTRRPAMAAPVRRLAVPRWHHPTDPAGVSTAQKQMRAWAPFLRSAVTHPQHGASMKVFASGAAGDDMPG